jgi:hypothetical protein
VGLGKVWGKGGGVTYVAGDVDLGYVAGEEVWDFRDGCDFHACAHDDDEVDLVLVEFFEAVEEIVGEGFAEEGDVGLHDAWLGNVVCAVGFGVFVAGALLPGHSAVGRPLSLQTGLLRCDLLETPLAIGRFLCAHRIEYVLARHVVLAFPARCRRPRAVALDQLVLPYASIRLDIIDVLRVVGEQLVLVLQQAYELVRGCPAAQVGDDVAGERIEGARVLVEVVDVEDLLGLLVAHLQQARVEARVLGAEVGYAEAGRDARARDDDDVLALPQQLGGVIDGAVLLQARALGQLAVDGHAQQLVEGLVRGIVKELGQLDAEGGAQLAGRHLLARNVLQHKLAGADRVEALAQGARLFGGACLGACAVAAGVLEGLHLVEDLLVQRGRVPDAALVVVVVVGGRRVRVVCAGHLICAFARCAAHSHRGRGALEDSDRPGIGVGGHGVVAAVAGCLAERVYAEERW